MSGCCPSLTVFVLLLLPTAVERAVLHWGRTASLAPLLPSIPLPATRATMWLPPFGPFLHTLSAPAAFMGETSKKSLSDFLQFIPTYLQQASVGCCAFRPPGCVMPLPATLCLPCEHCHGSALLLVNDARLPLSRRPQRQPQWQQRYPQHRCLQRQQQHRCLHPWWWQQQAQLQAPRRQSQRHFTMLKSCRCPPSRWRWWQALGRRYGLRMRPCSICGTNAGLGTKSWGCCRCDGTPNLHNS